MRDGRWMWQPRGGAKRCRTRAYGKLDARAARRLLKGTVLVATDGRHG